MNFVGALLLLTVFGCAAGKVSTGFQLNAKQTLHVPFESHDRYLSQSLAYPPFEKIRQQLETNLGQTLKNRGEAHITVITPPEWSILATHLKMHEANAMFRSLTPSQLTYEPVCVASAAKSENDRELKTYYVVVQAPGLVQLRRQLADLYKERGGTGPFSAQNFYPHVTLGFTEKDLHEQDGAIKDQKTCLPNGRLN